MPGMMRAAAGVGILLATACGDWSTGPSDAATVRVVNLTANTVDISANGTVPVTFGNVPFAVPTGCLRLDPGTVDLSLSTTFGREAVGSVQPLLTQFTDYAIVAYTGEDWTTQFLVLENEYAPLPGQSGLRIVDLSPDHLLLPSGVEVGFDVYAPGRVLRSINFGEQTPFFSVPAGANLIQLRYAGTSEVALSVTAGSLAPGVNHTLIIAPSPTSASAVRGVLLTAC
jgi:hypothetical protein